MHFVEVLLMTLFTVSVGYGQEHKANTKHPSVMVNEGIYFTEQRHQPDRYRRSDCYFSISSNCYCDDHCWMDSYMLTFSTNCGTSVNVNCCVIKSGNSYQLSTNCPEYGTYLDLACSQTGGPCYDGMTPYQCTCSNGYLPTTTTTVTTTTPTTVTLAVTTPQPDTPTNIAEIAAPIVIVFVCGIAIAATFLYQRIRKQRKSTKLDIKILSGVIPIQCNVIAVVDDVDEFKDYTKRLMVALHDRRPGLVFERVSTFDVLNDNYEIKCDKLLVFRRTNDATLKGHKLDALMKKVKFRNYKERWTVFICMGNNLTKIAEAREEVDELCMVPSLKHLDGWLPAAIKTTFNINARCFSICNNSTYFVHSEEQTPNSENCKELQSTVENILHEFGATVAQSENTAKCKLTFLGSVEDISKQGDGTSHNNQYIFVSSVTMLNRLHLDSDMNVYGRKDLILGIIRLLFNLNLISCKRLPTIEAMRYNPRTKEFVQYNKSNYCCV